MKIILTCSECGHQEWGTAEGVLMNKIKMWNHAHKHHPQIINRVLERSVPKQSFKELLTAA